MTFSRRDFLRLTALTAAAGALPAAQAQQDELVLWGPPVGPTVLLAAALANGKAKTIRPFRVESWKTPDQLRAGLVNGSIRSSVVPSYVAANLRAQGQDVVLHNIMTKGLLVLMSKDAPIQSPADLAGKKLVMPFKGDMPDLVLQILAKRSGVALQDLVSYGAAGPDAAALFIKRDFPHALLPEPLASASILLGKKEGIAIHRGLAIADWWNESFGTKAGIAQAGLMVQRAALAENADFFRQLDADLQDAVQWTLANPDAAADLAASLLPAPKPALAASFAHSALCAEPAKAMQDDILQFFRELYRLNPKITGGREPDVALFG